MKKKLNTKAIKKVKLVIIIMCIIASTTVLKVVIYDLILNRQDTYNIDDYDFVEIHFDDDYDIDEDSKDSGNYETRAKFNDFDNDNNTVVYLAVEDTICFGYLNYGGYIKIELDSNRVVSKPDQSSAEIFDGDKLYCEGHGSFVPSSLIDDAYDVSQEARNFARLIMNENKKVIKDEEELKKYYKAFTGRNLESYNEGVAPYDDMLTRIEIIDEGLTRYVKIDGYNAFSDEGEKDYVTDYTTYLKVVLTNDSENFDEEYEIALEVYTKIDEEIYEKRPKFYDDQNVGVMNSYDVNDYEVISIYFDNAFAIKNNLNMVGEDDIRKRFGNYNSYDTTASYTIINKSFNREFCNAVVATYGGSMRVKPSENKLVVNENLVEYDNHSSFGNKGVYDGKETFCDYSDESYDHRLQGKEYEKNTQEFASVLMNETRTVVVDEESLVEYSEILFGQKLKKDNHGIYEFLITKIEFIDEGTTRYVKITEEGLGSNEFVSTSERSLADEYFYKQESYYKIVLENDSANFDSMYENIYNENVNLFSCE